MMLNRLNRIGIKNNLRIIEMNEYKETIFLYYETIINRIFEVIMRKSLF